MALAGQQGFGSNEGDLFGGFLQGYQSLKDQIKGFSPEEQKEILKGYMTGMPSASDKLVQGLLQQQQYQLTPEYQEKMLEMADKYQTRKGWKSAMFNTLSSGLDNLTRGIAMSFNPYGTPEAARYAADIIAGSGDRMAAAYAAARTPLAIPAVQGGQAPTYF